MNLTCKHCACEFEAFKRRMYCTPVCRRAHDAAALRAARAGNTQHETPSNRRVEVNGATVVVQSGRAHVVNAKELTGTGFTDHFFYLRAITCKCGAMTAHNPYALPEFRSASGGWTEIDTERRTAVCPKCAEVTNG